MGENIGGPSRTFDRTPSGEASGARINTGSRYYYLTDHLDTASGLYKRGARFYDPTIGRFTQYDSLGQESHSYAYAGCNSVNASDPTDLSCLSATAIAFGQALLLVVLVLDPAERCRTSGIRVRSSDGLCCWLSDCRSCRSDRRSGLLDQSGGQGVLGPRQGKARITSLVVYLVLDVVVVVVIILFAKDPVVSVGLGLASGLGAIGLVLRIILEAKGLRRDSKDDDETRGKEGPST